MEIEIRLKEIPLPLKNYAFLIIDRKSPYYDLIKLLIKDMEFRYQRAGKSEIIYTINPRKLADEISGLVEKEEKLTTMNICRSILAFCHLCGLKKDKDFWVTTTSRGRRNYHFKVNKHLLSYFSKAII
jgi:hypothetical protein